MKFKNIKVKSLLINMFILLLYPVIKGCVSDNHLIAFSDACMILGLIMIVVGVVNIFFLSGDFDITGFLANRALNKEKQSFEVYMKNQEDKRKDSFNYPLLCAILLIIISYISALFV